MSFRVCPRPVCSCSRALGPVLQANSDHGTARWPHALHPAAEAGCIRRLSVRARRPAAVSRADDHDRWLYHGHAGVLRELE